MTVSNVQPMIEPDPEQMLRHLEHLFGGDLGGCQDGKIELVWSDAGDGKLRHAAIFGTDELDELVERAIAENSVPGQNTFIGQALRRPDIAPFGRCNDDDFLALTAFYVDLDDDVVATARVCYRHRGCPPTGVVVTGRHPHLRAQMLWRLETPERDPEACRRQNRALAEALGGDASVVNPSRVMRLGGSIAWPTKPGRIIERTQFLTFSDDRPKVYYPGQLAKAFPPSAVGDTPAGGPAKRDLNIGFEIDAVTVDACLVSIRAGDHWHNNMVRLTGHWIARGWSDAEILTAAEALTLDGYAVEQTRREVARMIEGGRRKWKVPNPAHRIDEAPAEPVDAGPIRASTLVDQPPPREWLVSEWIPLLTTTAMFGDGGVGKSLLAQQLAAAVATGKPFLGLQSRRLPTLCVFCEDDATELWRRQYAINGLSLGCSGLEDLHLWPRVGLDNLVITFDGVGVGALTPFFREIEAYCLENRIGFVVLDTIADTFGGDEVKRPQVNQYVKGACTRLALRIDGAVLICGHPSLFGMASGSGYSGSTAWNAAVRSRLYLHRPDPQDGTYDADSRILTRKKANYATSGDDEKLELRWDRGVFVLEAAGSSDAVERIEFRNVVKAVLREVAAAWDASRPFKAKGPRTLETALLKRLGSEGHSGRLVGRTIALCRHEGWIDLARTRDTRGYKVIAWPEWASEGR
jgi:hypothetical protein